MGHLGLGRGFCGLDLWQQDVADIVPVGNQRQRGMRILVGGVHVWGSSIQGGPCEAHEQLWLSPRRLERIADCTLRLARRFQALQVGFDGFVLAAAALRWSVPKNGAEDPDKTWIFGMGGSDFLNERDGLSEQLLDAIGMAQSEVHEIAEAGDGADFGVDEGGVLGGGFLELGDGLREIVFEIFGVGGIIEPVDGAAPESEAAPVA